MKRETTSKATKAKPAFGTAPFFPTVPLVGSLPSYAKNTVQKKEKTQGNSSLQAQKKLWDDIHEFFPKDGRKLAGSGYDEAANPLRSDFTEGENKGVSHSAPVIYVGKRYVKEADKAQRQAWIAAEMEKIDAWRVETGRIDDEDVSDLSVLSLIDQKRVMGKMELIKKMEGRKQHITNSKMMEVIKKKMPSTPWEEGAVETEDGGFELQFENIKLVVKPDTFNSSEVGANEAHTEIRRIDSNVYKTHPAYKWDGSNKITEAGAMSVPNIAYKVETHYGPQSNPTHTSGYGMGTRSEDQSAGNTSIRFHEGMHGTVFIQHIRDNIAANKFPVFTGKLGDDKADFEKKVAKYEKKVKAFDKMLSEAIEASTQKVDCVGKTIEEYHTEKGTVSKVKCKKN